MTDEAVTVTRSVDLDVGADVVWDAVADAERRQAWLDDPDAAGREVQVESVEPGRSLSWTWWHPEDTGNASRVDIVLTELATGGTRVVVTERPLLASQVPQARAGATPSAKAAATAWDYRLVGLELLLVAAGLCVG